MVVQFNLLYLRSFFKSVCTWEVDETSMNCSASGFIVIFPPEAIMARERVRMRAKLKHMLAHIGN